MSALTARRRWITECTGATAPMSIHDMPHSDVHGMRSSGTLPIIREVHWT